MLLKLKMTFFRKKKFLLFNGIVDKIHVDGDGVDRGDAVLDPAQHTQTTQLPLLTFQAFSSFSLFCIRTTVLVIGPQFCENNHAHSVIYRLQTFILQALSSFISLIFEMMSNIGPTNVQFLRKTALQTYITSFFF
jgi:hypothetical protein